MHIWDNIFIQDSQTKFKSEFVTFSSSWNNEKYVKTILVWKYIFSDSTFNNE